MSDITVGPGFVFTWKIEDFMHLLKRKISVQSPDFIIKSLKNTTWYLKISRENMEKSGKKYVEFYLYRYPSNEEVKLITIKYELELIDVNGLSLAKNRTEQEFEKSGYWGWKTFMEITEDVHISCQTVTARCTIWNKNNELHPSGICRSETRLEKKRGAFTWSLKDFSFLRPENRKNIEIKFDGSSSTPATTLSLYLDGKNADERFKLEAVQYDTVQWNIFSVKMSTSGNKPIDFAKGEHIFVKNDGPQIASFQSFLSKRDVIAQKDLYLPSVGLILQCEVTITSGKQIDSIEYVAVNPPILELIPYFQPDPVECPIKDDLDSLYEEEFLTDVTLHVGKDSFEAHKVLLCARSPVFRAMFTSGMSEATSDSLEIADFGADTVENMLQYFYTDTIGYLKWNDVSQLYQIADKYRVSSLKRDCSVLLKNQITTSNACNLLILSDRHLDDYLKTFVLDFISDYEQVVTRRDEWKKLEKDNLKLVCEAWKYMCHKTKQV